jgi:hypothetical protein
MWGQGTAAPTYTAADLCALEVTGRPELITVPGNAGSWHWTGSAAEHPVAEFLVVGGGQATLFPVDQPSHQGPRPAPGGNLAPRRPAPFRVRAARRAMGPTRGRWRPFRYRITGRSGRMYATTGRLPSDATRLRGAPWTRSRK